MSDNLRNNARKNIKQEEFNLAKLIQILNRRKILLFAIIGITLAAVIVYTYTSTPTYEASVLLKKEKQQKSVSPDELTKIISLQSLDEIETEMALVKTWEVLDKVVEELDLYLSIEKIVDPAGNAMDLNSSILSYNRNYIDKNTNAAKFPQFNGIGINRADQSYNVYAEKAKDGSYKIFDSESGKLLEEIKDDTVGAVIHFSTFDLALSWPDAAPGSKVYFKVNGYNSTMKGLSNRISVEQKAKTDVFKIGVQSNSPEDAQIIANVITDKFRETRIEQQKQTIRYSYDFVDNNLKEIQSKLEEAENNLSQYKSRNQIVSLDNNSDDLVRFISNLEAEKLKTELELTEYSHKITDMQSKLKQEGYFDQTFLTPGSDPTNSPFSTLMRQLSDLELKKLELLEKRTENHPEIQAINKQIDQAENKLSSYNENTLSSYSIIVNALEQKNNELSNMMAKYEGKLRVVPGQQNALAGLTRTRNVYDKMYTMLLDKREEMRMAELSKLQDIVIVDPAQKPVDPVSPRKGFNLAAGLIVGVLFGLIGVFIAEARSKKLVSLDDLEGELPYPIFAIIPNYPKEIKQKIKSANTAEERFVTLMDDHDGFKESYRVLRTKLNSAVENKPRILMFTSCEENTGKTSTVANLAISIAQSGKKVLAIDCDLRKGTLSRILNISKDKEGMISFLTNSAAPVNIYNRIDKNLDVIPAGGISDDSSDLLSGERISKLLEEVSGAGYDYIIFDTPPVTRVVDALILGKVVSDAVLILRPDHTFKESVKWGIQELEQAGIRICGTVINAGEIEKSNFRYRYGYGYGYKYTYKLGA